MITKKEYYDIYDDEECLHKWQTKDGIVIDMKDMTTEHIKNSINIVDRILRDMPFEAIYMGDSDAASDAVEQENARNESLREAWELKKSMLKEELSRREIKDANRNT